MRLIMKYAKQIDNLLTRKSKQTKAKLRDLGTRDEDDYGWVIPPHSFNVELPCVDEHGSFAGSYAWGKNFRWLMEHHPTYIDPDDAIAGRWMFMLSRMRKGYKLELSNFAFDYSHLRPDQLKYDITPGIGKDAHFAPDYQIGLKLGWSGLLDKVKKALVKYGDDPVAKELMEAEIDAIVGIQTWVSHLAEKATAMAKNEKDEVRRQNLLDMAECNTRLIDHKPVTLRETCQWLAHFNMASRTYNRDGAGGQLDELLRPYYESDLRAGRIDKEDTEFYILCLLLNDPHYYQLGGPDASGRDVCSELTFIILEAAAKLKSSCNLTIRVHSGMNRELFRRGVEVLLENKLGYPRFSGDKALVDGFCKNGYPVELARERIATGCNWMSLPGREYTLNDLVKINLAKVFEVAFQEMMEEGRPSLPKLQQNFTEHFRTAVHVAMQGIDFHLDHQYLNEPELLLNLLSHGPIEKGVDVSHGGAEFYNLAIDGAGLATVADSFAAVEQRIVQEKRLSWFKLNEVLKTDFSGNSGKAVRMLLSSSGSYGHGGTLGDKWAKRLTEILVKEIAGKRTPGGCLVIPGWFSWADTVRFGKSVGATPDGRHAYKAISHGSNPNPGFRRDNALSAAARAVAEVQPGYGNTAPWQLEIDIGLANSLQAVDTIMNLLEGHFNLGGTLVNINVIDGDTILKAHEHPELYPDLIVRVTGFSAYFTSLSHDFRQLVVDRIIREAV